MKKSTIVFIELGMLAGIVLAGYLLPARTPLWAFLVASGACLLAGNFLMVRKIKQIGAGENPAKGAAWPHIFRALAILAIAWLFIFLLSKR